MPVEDEVDRQHDGPKVVDGSHPAELLTLTGRPESGQAGSDLIERVLRFEGVVTVLDGLSYAGATAP